MKLVYNNSTKVINPEVIDLVIYPNPVSDKLFISTKEEIQKVEIFTLTGQKIYHSERNISNLDVSQLDSGNYLLKLFTREGIVSKLIIKK